jgi:ornithine carbamoyltransferase
MNMKTLWRNNHYFFMQNYDHQHRHLLSIADLIPEEVETIIKDAFIYKKEYDEGKKHEPILDGKTISLIFEKPSLRTRVAFDAAVASLGGHPVFQTGVEIFKRADGIEREKITDIGHVLERYSSAIIARVHDHDSLVQLTSAVSIPVINALCDLHHPTQALADLMAIIWHKPEYKNLKVAYFGDGNNVATSLMHVCTMMGLNFVHSSPPQYKISKGLWSVGLEHAQKNSTTLTHRTDPLEAAHKADVIYTDTFVSMGDEIQAGTQLTELAPYMVTSELMKRAEPDAIFLHCLPAHRGEEVTDEVIDSSQSKVFDLAECRMHIAKALLKFFLS